MANSKPRSITRELVDTAATEALGAELSLFLRPGDIVTLCGDLGTGKTTLARAIIYALAPQDGAFDVPSPTFTLAQHYDFTRIPVTHFDFYRLTDEDEAIELGFPDGVEDAIALAEWPERVATVLPRDRLDIELKDRTPDGRIATITGFGTWGQRLLRIEEIRVHLDTIGYGKAPRIFLKGDASARRYERLTTKPPVILMDSPAQPDGPVVRDGKPYSHIAHLAENVTAFTAIASGLDAIGLSAPKIHHADLEQGILLIEDFGDEVFGNMLEDPTSDMEGPYRTAVDALVHMASKAHSDQLPVLDGSTYKIPPFDAAALEIEAELLLDWFWPVVHETPASDEQRQGYLNIWRRLWPKLADHAPVWVMRDYHSPNLLWMEDRKGLKRLGIIDFQDAVMGHPAYDLASLLQDARVDVPQEQETRLLSYYCSKRAFQDPQFDDEAFRCAYAIMAAQRASKILGIFMRLKFRDGKPDYLKHVPRISHYIERTLAFPALAELSAWYDLWLPGHLRESAGQD